jgi:RNA recognition motif-containing protein
MNFNGPFPSFQPMTNPGGNKVTLAPALFVGNLDEFIQEENLFEFFSQFGPIHFVRIMRDSSTGRSRGYGFVNFVQPRDAEIAKIHAHHQQLGSKIIRVMFKRNMKDLPTESNLYVKNLDPNVSVIDLEKHFAQVGPVLSSKLSTNYEGKSLEYGYV